MSSSSIGSKGSPKDPRVLFRLHSKYQTSSSSMNSEVATNDDESSGEIEPIMNSSPTKRNKSKDKTQNKSFSMVPFEIEQVSKTNDRKNNRDACSKKYYLLLALAAGISYGTQNFLFSTAL